MSDHLLVCFVHKFCGVKSPKCSHDEIIYRNFKNLNPNYVIYNQQNAPWALLDVFEDVNEKLDIWELIFNDVMNRNIPIIKKRVKHKCLSPWMKTEIMHLIRLRDQFKECAKSNILAKTMYKKIRNQVVKEIASAKAEYSCMRNKIMKNMVNAKKLWKILKHVAPTKSEPSNFSFIEVNNQHIGDQES